MIRRLRAIAFIVIAGIYVFPALTFVLTAFRTNGDILHNGFLALPDALYIGGFSEVWETSALGLYVRNSFIVATISVVATLILASLAAYPLARYRFKLQTPVFLFFLVGLFFPPQVYIIPIYHLACRLRIYNTYVGLILVLVAFELPFCVLFLRGFFRTISTSILEAARIDGAGGLTALVKIVLPLSASAYSALAILMFTWVWNDFFWALAMTQDTGAQTIMVGISLYRGMYSANWNQEAASSLIATFPPLVVFIIFQRFFMKGVRMGAVK